MPMDVPPCGPGWQGDGICDDICNQPEMEFDGGDCCLDLINPGGCSFCVCYQDCTFHPQGDLIAGPPAPPAPPA